MAMTPFYIRPNPGYSYDPCESDRYEFTQAIKKLGFELTNPEVDLMNFTSECTALYVTENNFDAILVEKNKYTYINIGSKRIESGEFKNSRIFLRDLKLKKLINEQA
jgi:hypothetical protein